MAYSVQQIPSILADTSSKVMPKYTGNGNREGLNGRSSKLIALARPNTGAMVTLVTAIDTNTRKTEKK